MTVRVRSSAASDPGKAHTQNEDAFLADGARGLYVVSDGVGSHRGAGTASRLVVDAVSRAVTPELLAHPREAILRELPTVVRAAARSLADAAKANPSWKSMAATLTLLIVREGEVVLAHVGDSRAYLVRDGAIRHLTRDHSLAFEQYEIGALTKEQLRDHPNQKLLTRTLGPGKLALADISTHPVEAGDLFLLCSDGLTKELRDEEILALATTRPVEELAQALASAGNAAGGRDDVTVIAVRPGAGPGS